MQNTVSTRKPATRKPLIVSTTPLSDGSRCYGSFTFSDGVTVRQSGGLVCSEHGRRHCAHHKEAHQAIVAKAASQEVAPATVDLDFPMLMDVAAEVALVEAQMEAEGFTWSDEARTWERATEAAIEAAEAFDADYDAWLDVVDASNQLPTPANVHAPQAGPIAPVSMAQRAAAALPADRTPETFSVFAEVAR